MSGAALKASPLNAQHVALGAKLAPFGGWNMPLSYPDGTLAEHRSCRQAAAVFDVSHLGTVRVEGPGAFDRLQAAFTNDLAKIGPGRAQYTHLLGDDASVLDDIIVWWVDPERFDVMPNASNTDDVLAALGAGDSGTGGSGAADVRDVTEGRAVLAVQGPKARQLLEAVLPEAAAVGRFRVAPQRTGALGDAPVDLVVAGTGYTGEDGVEIAVPAEHAPALWDAVVAAGVHPAGLAARDTLRLEAGLPLHGSELGPGMTPLNARLGWVIAWDKPVGFPGRQALEAQRASGPTEVLWGLRTDSRRPPRAGQAVMRDGRTVGRVTSGNFSPVLGVGIALALLQSGMGPGDQVTIDQRGTEVPADVVKPPFVG
ncbi:MAG: glycine cleavage system aminomethyltransferase GcvT [Microthrixaceae bacterium]